MTNRRDFLKRASALTLGALFMDGMASKANAAEKNMMAGGPIGLQTYSLGPELSTPDVATGLKKVKASGYSYLELAGYREGNIGQVPVADFKKMVEVELKLKISKKVCHNTKKKIVQYLMGTYRDDYALLHDYVEVIKESNPGTTCMAKAYKNEETRENHAV